MPFTAGLILRWLHKGMRPYINHTFQTKCNFQGVRYRCYLDPDTQTTYPHVILKFRHYYRLRRLFQTFQGTRGIP
jgi:hypothetical protein